MKGIEKMTKGVEKMTKGKKRKQELLDIASHFVAADS